MEIKLTREQFWKYIKEANEHSSNDNEVIDYLVNKLTNKEVEEIFSFGIILDELMLESYNEKLWCASYLVNGDSSEESFDFFRLWLISKGKYMYDDVIRDADNLSKYIEEVDEDNYIEDVYENEDFFVATVEAYGLKNKILEFEEAFEKYLDDFDEYKEKIKYVDEDYPKIKFTWNEKVPKSMRKVCPKLYEKMYIGDEAVE